MAVTPAHKQQKRQDTYSAHGTDRGLDHCGWTILHGKAVVSGVTIYYAGIRRKIEENHAICDPDAIRAAA
jgi:hypothetical protein